MNRIIYILIDFTLKIIIIRIFFMTYYSVILCQRYMIKHFYEYKKIYFLLVDNNTRANN